MVSNFVSSIPGIEYYPIVALVFLFAFFAALTAWFFLHNRERFEAYATQPLDTETEPIANRSHSTLAL